MQNPPDPVPSPCNQDCCLDPVTGLCRGCLRTGEEIMAWPFLTAAQRRALLQKLLERRRPH